MHPVPIFKRKVTHRLGIVLGLLFGTITYGTIGIFVLEKASLFDSFYMAVITLTTVGFSETIPLSHPGRIFTVSVIFLGVANSGISISIITNLFFEETLNQFLKGKQMMKFLKDMRDHYIVCGYGVTGQSIVEVLMERGFSVVIIDSNPPEDSPHQLNRVFLKGDARDDDVLMTARIEHARGLATTLTEDSDNVFVVLSARALHPDIEIVSRYKNESTGRKLRIAGVNQAISPYRMGGRRLAMALLSPAMTELMDAILKNAPPGMRFDYITLPESLKKNRSLGDLRPMSEMERALIVGLVEQSEEFLFNPPDGTPLDQIEQLLILGEKKQIDAFSTFLANLA